MTIGQLVHQLVSEAISLGGWMEMDRLYLQNKILTMIGENDMDIPMEEISCPLEEIINQFVEIARKNAVVTHVEQEEILRGQLYDLITPPPSVLNALFAQRYNTDKEEATRNFYSLSLKNKTIKEKNENSSFKTNKGTFLTAMIFGDLTENIPNMLSQYPLCPLCFNNEGYTGKSSLIKAPLRYIRMNLQGDSFGFKFVPYPLWEEHCIFVSESHDFQMHGRKTIEQMFQIAEVFPQYFVAADSDLLPNSVKPQHIVYQGGKKILPIFNCVPKATFMLEHYPKVKVEIMDYPITTCHLVSAHRDDLMNLVIQIIQAWRLYQDDGFEAFSKEGALNHSVNVVVHKNDEQYEVYLVFRNHLDTSSTCLYNILGVQPVDNHCQEAIYQLIDNLLAEDPFGNQQSKIDHWMKKINSLGESK